MFACVFEIQEVSRAFCRCPTSTLSCSMEGNIDATKKITVRKGGRLLGDLRTPGILIEDGAYFKGQIEIVNSQMGEEPAIVAASSTTVAAAG
jgi:cytoskeletal protein CcmA (bactofilin family)